MKSVSIFLITIALIAGMAGCGDTTPPSQNLQIRTWYDLDAVRNNLGGHYLLMRNLDATTAGYAELASPTANQGKGWQPIGTQDKPFTGSFDGQGHEIRDLYINRPNENGVGLFGVVDAGGIVVVNDISVVNISVTGGEFVGGLVGRNYCGTVSNSYSTGSVTGQYRVGGLVGSTIWMGFVSNCYSTCNVTGGSRVGGLVGDNAQTVSNSYSTGSVTGIASVGGLMGVNGSIVSNSYATGNVTGNYYSVGGLVGENYGTVNDSYSTGNVTGDDYVGGLVGGNFYESNVNSCYSIGSVTGNSSVGGLVGWNDGTVGTSFWDTKTSGQATSDGGTGKNTTEMKNIATFSGAGWSIIEVTPGSTNTTYIWNIVNAVTYPFLSWQP
jgi:hypothetical protein